MPPNASMDSILKACVKGTKKAWKEYYEISGGEWLWTAPEYFITVKIFEELSKLNLLLELESKVGETISNANMQYPGRYPRALKLNGRFDITLWWKNGYPRGVIEVKTMRSNSLNPIKSDLEEITEFLRLARNKDSKVQFGIITVYTDYYDEGGKADKVVGRRLSNVLGECKSVSKRNDFEIKWEDVIKKVENEESAYGIIACLLKV